MDPMEKTELKPLPCPFCGGTTSTIIITSPIEHNVIRKCARLCLSCDARGPEVVDLKYADKKWNTRTK
jgi:Lar family restriction alleviation protein